MSKVADGYYTPPAVILAIIAIAITLWGSITFALVSGVI